MNTLPVTSTYVEILVASDLFAATAVVMPSCCPRSGPTVRTGTPRQIVSLTTAGVPPRMESCMQPTASCTATSGTPSNRRHVLSGCPQSNTTPVDTQYACSWGISKRRAAAGLEAAKLASSMKNKPGVSTDGLIKSSNERRSESLAHLSNTAPREVERRLPRDEDAKMVSAAYARVCTSSGHRACAPVKLPV